MDVSEPKPPRGRPPIGERDCPAPRVHVRVHPAQYDRVYDAARRQGVSIPEVMRRGLKRYLDDDDD